MPDLTIFSEKIINWLFLQSVWHQSVELTMAITMQTISILIRTKNEAAFIGKALELVAEQTVQPHEIIVVDSESTDDTVKIVQQWQSIKLIHMPACEFTFGRSLNLGCQAATGDIIVSLSAHAFPVDRTWLENLIKHFENPKVAGVYGRQLPQPDAWPPVRRAFLSYYGDTVRYQTDPNNRSDRTFSNANSAIRRSCWQVQSFDEQLPAAEDQEWAWRMLDKGCQIVYEPEAAVYHSHNEKYQQLVRRSHREARAFRKLYQSEAHLLGSIKRWVLSSWADIRYVQEQELDPTWIWKSPIYHAAAIYGSLRASSWLGLLNLKHYSEPIS